MEFFREQGYIVGSVERRKRFPARGKQRCRACGAVPMVDISHDLWNVFDLIAINPLTPVGRVLVQTTSASNHASRRTKILTSPEAKFCLQSGMSICIQSWVKKNNRWQSREEWLTLDQFSDSLPATVPEFYEAQRKAKLPDLPPGADIFPSPVLDEGSPF